MNDEEYGAIVEAMKTYIRRGDIFQVVPSRRFQINCPSPLAAYQVLKQKTPVPICFICKMRYLPFLVRHLKVR